jgi:hypothetical protein
MNTNPLNPHPFDGRGEEPGHETSRGTVSTTSLRDPQLTARAAPAPSYLEPAQMDILINLANTLYVVAYFTTNMLRLRVLTLVAAACLATYFATRPEPLWTVVGWNVFFLLLNLWQLIRLMLAEVEQRRPKGAQDAPV